MKWAAMSSPLSPQLFASSPSPKRSPSLVLWQRICSACSMVMPGQVQDGSLGVHPAPAMSRPPAETGGMIGCESMAAHTLAGGGPLQMTFEFVPPCRFEKSFVPGVTWLPGVAVQALAAAGDAGENVWLGPSSHPAVPSDMTAARAATAAL